MKLTKILVLGTFGAASLAALASCGNSKKGDYKYTLNVSIPTGVIRTSVDIVADELGYFEDEGLKINAVNLSGTNALTALNNNSKELDVLTLGFVPDVQAISSGYDNIRFIGGTAVEGGALITKKGNASKYQDPETIINYSAIKNAKLGSKVGEASWVVTNQYLIDNDDSYTVDSKASLKFTTINDDQTTAQLVGKGDIEVGFLPLEYANLYADAYGIEVIAKAGELSPEYVCCRQATSKEKYEENYDAFVAYEKAKIKAWKYIENEANKKKVVDIVTKYTHKEEDYIENYLYTGITKWSVDPNTKGIIEYTEALKNAGVLKNEISDVSSYVETGAYLDALNSLLKEDSNDEFYKAKKELYNSYNVLK